VTVGIKSAAAVAGEKRHGGELGTVEDVLVLRQFEIKPRVGRVHVSLLDGGGSAEHGESTGVEGDRHALVASHVLGHRAMLPAVHQIADSVTADACPCECAGGSRCHRN
jgi:hypothetical protein